MDTDCLTESEFIDWHCFDFHIKIWNNQRIEKFIYSTYEKQEVINYIKKEYPDCIIKSIRRGKLTHPEIHKKVLKYNEDNKNEKKI